MSETNDKKPAVAEEPLPIWFFVGVLLGAYGLIVLAAGVAGDARSTVLSELRPSLWWGGIMIAAGALFTAIGLIGHRQPRAPREE
ncbi:MAG: hypothetical protein JXR96_22515 [Deltaproteobacteria bacterium]|nr:hypothetical protein [Deltaproteobacteria bacterium]